ncbi:hypothetical protein LINPERHAP1_LOCUS4745, partial [Linum perenne]
RLFGSLISATHFPHFLILIPLYCLSATVPPPRCFLAAAAAIDLSSSSIIGEKETKPRLGNSGIKGPF